MNTNKKVVGEDIIENASKGQFAFVEKIENGQMKPCVYKILPFEMANEALGILERGENIGKVVIKISD